MRNWLSDFRFKNSVKGTGRFREIFLGGRDCSVNLIGEGTDMILARASLASSQRVPFFLIKTETGFDPQ